MADVAQEVHGPTHFCAPCAVHRINATPAVCGNNSAVLVLPHVHRHMQQAGWDVTYLPVQSDGLVSMDQLRSELRDDTAMVSIMAVNNEIGAALFSVHVSCMSCGMPLP